MIPLEQQVTSLELSKQLKELGVKQDSLFSWIEYDNGGAHVEMTKWAKTQYGGIGRKEKDLFAAFTVAELGEMLPQGTHSFKFAESDYRVWNETVSFSEPKEADARAKMRIWLIENKLVEGS